MELLFSWNFILLDQSHSLFVSRFYKYNIKCFRETKVKVSETIEIAHIHCDTPLYKADTPYLPGHIYIETFFTFQKKNLIGFLKMIEIEYVGNTVCYSDKRFFEKIHTEHPKK